ncbi:Cyclopropane fatty-acyl-phospholipid synthase [Pseudomonas grimontii]|uniref:Cyclopropane fatty-acyl-phospholipid synthase n=1 Tax=Pseudomonas grimontii TaxID=129847 RepID=A0A1H1IP03_9PSED|nr:class I SAM-dependent methyltransferase [Pseudomonas grimontii]TWR70468.1 methyltransferase domain-containing protein [Pseudomonas grimontii]SDR39437.1 Cyclopropane fatty-acyl-phospholipid synthase [Pseudomonas grimontii]
MPAHESKIAIDVIRSSTADHYQSKIESVYADPPEEWRKVIGNEFWYQYGVFDEKMDPNSLALDASGRRHMEHQFELAEQAGADVSSQSIRRAIDIGCGWGPVLSFLAKRYPHCERIDGVNVSRPQLEFASQTISRNLADRIRLYLCNAKDIGALPDPQLPYDLAIFRGSLFHFTPQVLQETMQSLAQRMRTDGTVIISESLYTVDLATYQSFIPDKVDRAASGHRKTPDSLQKALEDNGFEVIDRRITPSNEDVIRWYGLVKDNLDAHYPDSRNPNFSELRDIAINFSDALRKNKASSFSFIACKR